MARENHLTRRAFVSMAALAATGLAACSNGAMPQGEVDDAAHEGRAAEPGGTEPAVYLVRDVSPEAMQAVFDALGTSFSGARTGVKLSTGEPGSNPLDPELISGLVRAVDGTIVECNTAYGGERGETAHHLEVAAEHGYTGIADVQIMDEDGSASIPVEGGEHLTENLVGAHFPEYDGFLVLSHFKGHAMAGFGGALKNISIGMASREGKCLIHTDGRSHDSPWGGETAAFQECMAEAAKSVVDAVGGNILFVNAMNHLSVDCDCDSSPAPAKMADIGILASADPVALDQACVDLVYSSDDDSADLIGRIESLGGEHVLEHAEKIGLGSRGYRLVEVGA
ncbi:DUF362 domain-containing protein [Thermophilibacter provencensis]|uniref:DUF362 domain-containing protein n=1 Tax=Thermophilibacter provencensis TaxID=1852386 RepID=UPI00094B6A4F|nr:DUF362 domain-containing protein [Thermophilibacter provencensis]